ncbi:hypothetical protein D3C71_2226130 [compost metagenome]
MLLGKGERDLRTLDLRRLLLRLDGLDLACPCIERGLPGTRLAGLDAGIGAHGRAGDSRAGGNGRSR